MKLNDFLRRSNSLCVGKQVQKVIRCKSFNSCSSKGIQIGRKICLRITARYCYKVPTFCRFIHTGKCFCDSESHQDTENDASGAHVIDYTVFTKNSHSKVLDDAEEDQSQMQPEISVENKKHQRKMTKR